MSYLWHATLYWGFSFRPVFSGNSQSEFSSSFSAVRKSENKVLSSSYKISSSLSRIKSDFNQTGSESDKVAFTVACSCQNNFRQKVGETKQSEAWLRILNAWKSPARSFCVWLFHLYLRWPREGLSGATILSIFLPRLKRTGQRDGMVSENKAVVTHSNRRSTDLHANNIFLKSTIIRLM